MKYLVGKEEGFMFTNQEKLRYGIIISTTIDLKPTIGMDGGPIIQAMAMVSKSLTMEMP